MYIHVLCDPCAMWVDGARETTRDLSVAVCNQTLSPITPDERIHVIRVDMGQKSYSLHLTSDPRRWQSDLPQHKSKPVLDAYKVLGTCRDASHAGQRKN
eukprot:6527201-Pyramimonas_sp.AAC.1